MRCCLYLTAWLLGVKSISCLTVFPAPMPKNALSEQLSLFLGEVDHTSWCRWNWKLEVLNFGMSPVFPVFLSGWAALKTVCETCDNYLILPENKGRGQFSPCHLQCKVTDHHQRNEIRIFGMACSIASGSM